jgi:Mn-dependent DtxR family transcriptional regulator
MGTKPEGTEDEISYPSILTWLSNRDWPVTSPQLAEHFGVSQQAAYYRLKRLYERDEIERKKYGHTVLWRAKH